MGVAEGGWQSSAMQDDFFVRIERLKIAHVRYLELTGEYASPPRIRGLSRASIRVLRAIERSLFLPSVGGIARATGFSQTHVTHTLQSLEETGLVSGHADQEDRRLRVYRLTEDGSERAAAVHALTVRRLERIATRWWPGDCHAVANMLEKIVVILERSPHYPR